MDWFYHVTLGELGSYASILGAVITLWVLFQVRSIRRSYFQRVRLPQVRRQLSESSRILLKEIGRWPLSEPQVLAEIRKVRAVIWNIEGRVPRRARPVVRQTKKAAGRDRQWWFFKREEKTLDRKELWNIYSEIMGLITALDELTLDLQWDS